MIVIENVFTIVEMLGVKTLLIDTTAVPAVILSRNRNTFLRFGLKDTVVNEITG